jgi:hypothetical protein
MPPSSNNVGYLEVPQNSQSAGYTTVLSDSGKQIDFIASGSTITIAANASVAYPIGTVITFINMTGGNVSINCADTMYLAVVGTTGIRTLANYGISTAVKVSITTWLINGAGLS